MRLPSLFAPVAGRGETSSREDVALPPSAPGGSSFPHPAVLLIQENAESGGFILLRVAADGAFGGDTWHPNLEEAREQAEWEYEAALGEWREIPPGVEDEEEYALAQLR